MKENESCPKSYIGQVTFTPGVPTEDGWYVVKVQYTDCIGYETVRLINGMPEHDTIILSHAKLPEL